MTPAEPVDLTNCDREPIHIPGSIQPHGTMLVCDVAMTRVLRHAANAAAMLGLEGDLNGATIDGLLGGHVAHELRNALARSLDPARPGLVLGLKIGAHGPFDAAVHQFKGNAIIEFETAPHDTHSSPLEVTRSLTGRLGKIGDVDDLVRAATRLIRGLLGYDRVMIYRFAHDGAGKVVAEAKRPDLESFLGQYFPASDIPQQARQLYLRNTIRVISDANYTRVPIHPAFDASGEPVDLSHAHLRSVSPVHCEYLRNMGVGASMSVSIVIGGQLWGLIACHHYAPRILSLGQRVAAEMFGEFFALHLEGLSNRQKLDTARRARLTIDRLLTNASHETDIVGLLRQSLPDLMSLMPCNGIGLWMGGSWTSHAVTPPDKAVPALARFVGNTAEGRVWATHALSGVLPEAEDYQGDVSGVLAVPLSQIPRDYLFFFRREVVQTLDWAGNPEKTYEVGPLGDRLTPRKSFSIWKQTVERQSLPWEAEDREIAEAARGALVETVLRHSEMIADERSKADLRQKMLNEELNHRVKNILALIKSLVSHPVEAGRSLESYIESLRGRIQALSVAHDQVVRGDGGGVLADLLAAELSPYRESANMRMEGPSMALDSRAFSVMALILHEMATNAAKYGALSTSVGRLEVHWSLDASGALAIEWRETGGPVVSPPKRQGFGSVLIGRSVPYDLGGESEISYAPDGVVARFTIPARFISRVSTEAAQTRAPVASHAAPAKGLNGLTLLLVEDQLLIAMDAEAMLADHGVATIETAASAQEALKKLARFRPDAAVLDVNLGSGTSIPVAETLKKMRVPFIFATGYGDSITIPRDFKDAPVVRKPYDSAALVAALAQALASDQPG